MARKLSRRDVAQYVARELANGASQKKLAQQLAAYLIETRRTSELSVVVRDIAMYLAEAGYVTGTLTTAHELSKAAQTAIEAFAKKQTGAKHVVLDTTVDESVLGGVRLELPGQELDTTISRQLTLLKTRYKKA